MDFQDRIITWHRFERYVRVPAIASKFARLGQQIDLFRLSGFLLDRGDDTDLIELNQSAVLAGLKRRKGPQRSGQPLISAVEDRVGGVQGQPRGTGCTAG